MSPKNSTSDRPTSQFGIALSLADKKLGLPLARKDFGNRVKSWQKELEAAGHLRPERELLEPKHVYYSTGLGDFSKVATWAQYCGVELEEDLEAVDRQHFVLVAVEQIAEVSTFVYGLLDRATGSITHLFNLVMQDMGKNMAARHIAVPSWMDLKDPDHYRLS